VKQKNKRFHWAGGLTPVRFSGATGQAQKDTDTALMVHFVNKNYKFGTRINAD